MSRQPVHNWLTGSLLRSAGFIAATIILLCLVVFLFYAVAITPITPQDQNLRSLYVILIPMLLTALGITAAITWASFSIVRRRRMLDNAFLHLGFVGSSYFLNGRQYRGVFSGRQVNIYLSRGPQMEIYLESSLRTRLSVAPSDPLIQWIAKRTDDQPVPIEDPNFSHLSAYAADRDWALRLFALPDARSAMLRLADLALTNSPQITIQPGSLALRLPRVRTEQLTAGLAQQKLSFLILLARLAESLPPPSKSIEASVWEINAQTNRNAFFLPSLGLVIGTIAVVAAAAAACIFGLNLITK